VEELKNPSISKKDLEDSGKGGKQGDISKKNRPSKRLKRFKSMMALISKKGIEEGILLEGTIWFS